MKESTKFSLLSSFTTFFEMLVMPFTIIYFSRDLRIAIGMLGIIFAIQSAAHFVLSVPFNWLGDKIARKPFMMLANFVGAGCFYYLTKITHIRELFILMIIMGIASAAGSVGSGFVAKLTEGSERGKKMGLMQMFMSLSAAAAMLIGAKVIEMFGFHILFYIAAGAMVFEGLMLLGINPAKEPKGAPKDKTKL